MEHSRMQPFSHMVAPILFTFSWTLALSCGGGAASSSGSSDPATDDAVARTSPTAVTDPNEAGEKGCRAADDCTLTNWACSPCGICPFEARTRAVLVSSLAAAQAECERSGGNESAPCQPCLEPDPTFRDWTSFACVDGRCVAHELGPTLAERMNASP